MEIVAFWRSINEGQGSVLAAVITVVGVIIGYLLFSRKVKSFEEGLETTSSSLAALNGQATEAFGQIRVELKELKAEFTTTRESLGQLRGAVADIEGAADDVGRDPENPNLRDRIRAAWGIIRDKLEELAAAQWIDGRRRAKYARIDRRKYAELIEAMADDNSIQAVEAETFKQANELRLRYRSSRTSPREAHAAEMERFAQAAATFEPRGPQN